MHAYVYTYACILCICAYIIYIYSEGSTPCWTEDLPVQSFHVLSASVSENMTFRSIGDSKLPQSAR